MSYSDKIRSQDDETLKKTARVSTAFALVVAPVALLFGYIWIVNAATGVQSNVTMIFALVGFAGVILNGVAASASRRELRRRAGTSR